MIVNIYANIFVSLFMIKFFFDKSPMVSKQQNILEIMNESNLLFFNYSMLLFTDFIPSVEIRYQLGFVFIGIVVIILSINLALISKSMFQD